MSELANCCMLISMVKLLFMVGVRIAGTSAQAAGVSGIAVEQPHPAILRVAEQYHGKNTEDEIEAGEHDEG